MTGDTFTDWVSLAASTYSVFPGLLAACVILAVLLLALRWLVEIPEPPGGKVKPGHRKRPDLVVNVRRG